MLNGILRMKKAVAVFTLAMAAITSPVMAGGVSDCYNDVMESCNDALEAAHWWEKPAVGLFCTGMLAGCGFEAI